MRRIALLAAVSLLSWVPTDTGGASPSPTRARPEAPPPAYYRPVVVDGMAFPVARSNWLSVIEFRDDWHDPRYRLIDGEWRLVGYHEGVDIAAEEGTPVISAHAGTVEAAGWTFYSGTRIGVRGTDGRYYFYAHLSDIAPSIVVGTPVPAGAVLGRVGSTGYGPPGHRDEFPPHLHFGVQGGEGWVNPYPMVASLYRRSVAATTAAERRLGRLARQGRPEAFERLRDRLYDDLEE